MNRKLTQEEFDNLWYTPYSRIWKDPRHFQVVPLKEIYFEGPFHSPRIATLTLKSVCNVKAAYIIECSSPNRFSVTPTMGIVEPGDLVIVRIAMYPNVANEVFMRHTFKLSSIVVIEPLKLSKLCKRWMEIQPHNMYEELWTCRFDQPVKPVELSAFYDCQHLPLPPPTPTVTRRQREVKDEAKTLRKQNRELRFRVRTLRDDNEMRLRSKLKVEARPTENIEDVLEGFFLLFGMNVHHMLVRDVRLTIIYIEIALFLIGVLIGLFCL